MKKSTAWFGYGTQEAYHKAKPFVALFRSLKPCQFKDRYTVAGFRFKTPEEAQKFVANMNDAGNFIKIVKAPKSRGFEGVAEEAYPHYIL